METERAMGGTAAGQLATVLKALADPLRLRALSLIATSPTGEASVGDIADLTDVSGPTVSHHLKVLRDVGLLTSDRRGTWVYYAIVPTYRAAVTMLLEAFGTAATAAASPALAAPTAGLADVDDLLTRIGFELAARYTDVETTTVLTVVRDSYTALARRSGVRTHLVVAAERFARQRLDDMVAVAAGASARPPHVLFVCVANAGRSQLAAALLQHYAGQAIVVRSAGSAPAGAVHASVSAELASLGIAVDSGEVFPKPLTDEAVRAADVVITMGCGDTCPVLPGKRYEDWAVGDPALASPAGVAAIRAEIDARVRALFAELAPSARQPATQGARP